MFWRPPAFLAKLLMHNNRKDQLTLLLYKQTSLTFVHNALTDLYFLDLSRKPTFLLLSRPYQSILHAKQVELAPVHCELRKIHSFRKDAKSTDQQNKFQKIAFFLMEIIFQNNSYFTGTWTYPVRLPIPSMQ